MHRSPDRIKQIADLASNGWRFRRQRFERISPAVHKPVLRAWYCATADPHGRGARTGVNALVGTPEWRRLGRRAAWAVSLANAPRAASVYTWTRATTAPAGATGSPICWIIKPRAG